VRNISVFVNVVCRRFKDDIRISCAMNNDRCNMMLSWAQKGIYHFPYLSFSLYLCTFASMYVFKYFILFLNRFLVSYLSLWIFWPMLFRYRDACRPPPRLLSTYPAQLLVDIPHHSSWEPPELNALLWDQSVCWVLPPDRDAVVVCVYDDMWQVYSIIIYDFNLSVGLESRMLYL